MNLDLENKKIENFKLIDIFSDIAIAPSSDLGNINKGQTSFIGRTMKNNGIQSFVNVENEKILKGNCITVSMVGTNVACYQFKDITCSQNILVLRRDNLNKYIGIFLSSILNRYLETGGFGYGHPLSLKRFRKSSVPLPTNSKGKPDYEFMEQYMRHKEEERYKEYQEFIKSRLQELKNIPKTISLNEKEWREFFLSEIFVKIQRGKRLKKADHKNGNQPYISSTGSNNGLDGYVGNKEKVRIFKDCITLANSGSVGSCFYQPYSFVASDHVTKLENREFSKNIYLFISSIVARLGEKYSFNREMNDTRIKREKIMLPINENNQPDYEFMENYMKSLEYKKLSEYFEFKKKHIA